MRALLVDGGALAPSEVPDKDAKVPGNRSWHMGTSNVLYLTTGLHSRVHQTILDSAEQAHKTHKTLSLEKTHTKAAGHV